MTTTNSNTLKFARRLKDAGVPGNQGRLGELKTNFAHLERDILVLKWIVGLITAVTVVSFIKSILG